MGGVLGGARAGRLLLALWVVVAVLGGASSARADDAGGARIVGERSVGDRALELTIATKAFTAPARVQVFLPAGYDAASARRWPVVFYLHGMQGDQARFGQWYGDLIRDFPAIFVAPDGGFGGFYSDWYNRGAGGPPMYETYDIDQLIPLIDGRFRTVGARAGRALIGESMGGYGVMTYATRHPDLFVSAMSLSGLLDSNFAPAGAVMSAGPLTQGGLPDSIYGPRAAEEVRWRGHNPTDLAENLRGMDLQVRTADGTPTLPDDAGSASACVLEMGIHQTSTDFHQQLGSLGIPHVWKDYGPGCHTIPIFRREFADALPHLRDELAHPPPAPRTVTYRSIEPHFGVWGWRVDADPARALEFLQLREASRAGATLVGSGTTTVTTPPYFRGAHAVDVVAGGTTRAVTPQPDGRLRFTVDLGPAHPDQEYGAAAQAAGEDQAAYFTRRQVRFAPRR